MTGTHAPDHPPAGGVPVVILAGSDDPGKGILIGRFVTGGAGARAAIFRDAIEPGERGTTPHGRLLRRLGDMGGSGLWEVIVYCPAGTELVVPAVTAVQDEALAGLVHLAGVITVVDAARFWDDYAGNVDLVDDDGRPNATVPFAPILVEQIEAASVLMINQTEQVNDATLRDLEGYLVNLNPDAVLSHISAGHGSYGTDGVPDLGASRDSADGRFGERDGDDGDRAEVDGYGFNSFVYAPERPLTWDAFAATLEDWPDEVRRCRGYAVFADHPPVLLSIVRDTCELTVLDDGGADHDHDNDHDHHDHDGHDHGQPCDEDVEGTELVFIGRDMPIDAIVDRLNACLADEEGSIS